MQKCTDNKKPQTNESAKTMKLWDNGWKAKGRKVDGRRENESRDLSKESFKF